MRSATTVASALVLLIALPERLDAQGPISGPRAGAWGTELRLSAGQTTVGGSIMRFTNDRSALILGLDASLQRMGRSRIDVEGNAVTEEFNRVLTGARVGFLSLRSPGSRVRPVLGAGIFGSLFREGDDQTLWDAGAYGELGVSRFFGESFSLGVRSQLEVRRGAQRSGEFKLVETGVRFDAVRIAAMMVF